VAAHAATSTSRILNGTGVGSGAWEGQYLVQSGAGFSYAGPPLVLVVASKLVAELREWPGNIESSGTCTWSSNFPSHLRHVRLAYQPPASSTFLSQQITYQQPASSTFLQNKPASAISHQSNEHAVGSMVVPYPFPLNDTADVC
jgi:hypothetical protein